MGEEWFAVLPDSDTGFAAARALRPLASCTVEHASGRPWLLGHWSCEQVTVAAAGTARLVVAGECPATAASLRESLRTVDSVLDLDRVTAGLPGCFHALASIGGRVRVQGTLASVRRVFRVRFGDAVVAADSARVLAQLTAADWDPAWLALRLASTASPFPLHETTPWHGVRAVPGDHWLALEQDGTASRLRRWSPPEPELPLAEGASAVRDALSAAVNVRTAAGGTVSSDLSGGMDSTSVTFLAAHG
ncbi:MAG: asparagine synthase-related protein, partial [Streptomyces sp.]